MPDGDPVFPAAINAFLSLATRTDIPDDIYGRIAPQFPMLLARAARREIPTTHEASMLWVYSLLGNASVELTWGNDLHGRTYDEMPPVIEQPTPCQEQRHDLVAEFRKNCGLDLANLSGLITLPAFVNGLRILSKSITHSPLKAITTSGRRSARSERSDAGFLIVPESDRNGKRILRSGAKLRLTHAERGWGPG